MTRSQPWKMRGVNWVEGTVCAKDLGCERVWRVGGAEWRVERVQALTEPGGGAGAILWGYPSLYPVLSTYALSISCSRSCTLRLSSSAGGKLLPTFMKRAAILLLRRKPAARLRRPCRTQASTAAAGTQRSAGPAHAPQCPAWL